MHLSLVYVPSLRTEITLRFRMTLRWKFNIFCTWLFSTRIFFSLTQNCSMKTEKLLVYKA